MANCINDVSYCTTSEVICPVTGGRFITTECQFSYGDPRDVLVNVTSKEPPWKWSLSTGESVTYRIPRWKMMLQRPVTFRNIPVWPRNNKYRNDKPTCPILSNCILGRTELEVNRSCPCTTESHEAYQRTVILMFPQRSAPIGNFLTRLPAFLIKHT